MLQVQAGNLWISFPMSLDFSIDLILQPHCGPVVNLASNRNEYQKFSMEKLMCVNSHDIAILISTTLAYL
jgi:hypothetical protein